jgi:hypothetical protein
LPLQPDLLPALNQVEINFVARRTLPRSRAEQIMVCEGGRVKFAAGLCARFATARGRSGLGRDLQAQIRGMMNAFSEHREELERYEQMFGLERGRLAVSLDRLTNALVLVGQHGVYCTSNRNPMVPAMDLRIISMELTHAKELLQSVMEELRKKKEAEGV